MCEYLAETYDEEMLWYLLESMGSDADPEEVLQTLLQVEPGQLARRAGRLMLQTYEPDSPVGGSPSGSPTN